MELLHYNSPLTLEVPIFVPEFYGISVENLEVKFTARLEYMVAYKKLLIKFQWRELYTAKYIVRLKVNFGSILCLAESCRFDSERRLKKCGSENIAETGCKELGCCYVLQKDNSTWRCVEASEK